MEVSLAGRKVVGSLEGRRVPESKLQCEPTLDFSYFQSVNKRVRNGLSFVRVFGKHTKHTLESFPPMYWMGGAV